MYQLPRRGLEPPPHFWDTALNRARLPIPPPGHVFAGYYTGKQIRVNPFTNVTLSNTIRTYMWLSTDFICEG
jgi:hypothetical protein